MNNLNWTWLMLVKFEKIPIVQKMYIWLLIVPISVKVLSEVEDVVTLKLFENNFVIHLTLPFSWQFFYISALLFTIANLFVKLRCPLIVNENYSYGDFVNSGRTLLNLNSYCDQIGIDMNSLQQSYGLVGELGPVTKEKLEKDTFWYVYNYANYINWFERYLISLTYLAAFFLIGYVVLQNLFFVLGYLEIKYL